ncbi:hypothetical protein FYJ38_09375 [Clostridium sp. WB02_MRS01]|uniref:hypothetical protein n=1 Tax=Clostridium sp. WB02_MRS01 TaxID=2605777 RepID=UPI0012B33EAD|nr:hypothetical protein [Clostridium sp. WB02_MRS01]MSS08857.1 hypothetical protein [Clostridium sp. WB02_MRS01]
MEKAIKKLLEFWNGNSLMDKVLIVLAMATVMIGGGIMGYYLVTKILPIIVLITLFVGCCAIDYAHGQKNQQDMVQREETMRFMELYEQVARAILPILMEYKMPLGIIPTTINSIYSAEKYTGVTDLAEPMLIYTIEKKAQSTIEMSDLKSAIQNRFNQESFWLYLARIDQRDSQFLKLYILPINSENARNWALSDMKNQFSSTRPQKPGSRRDKDF